MKYSIIENTVSGQNGESLKMYGIMYDDGFVVRRFEELVTEKERLEEIVKSLNETDATLEAARQCVEDILFEAYCKYL